MDTTVVEVLLPNGTTALVRATNLDGIGVSKAGFADRFGFDEVAAMLDGLSEAIKSSLTRAAPDKVTVEVGVELAVKSGKLVGLVVEGQGKGSLTVTFEWELGSNPRAT